MARTKAGKGLCIGAMTCEGEALRLVPPDSDGDEYFNWPHSICPFELGAVYEVEGAFRDPPHPPHIEDFIVPLQSWKLVKRLSPDELRQTVSKRAVVWTGPLGRYDSDVFNGAVRVFKNLKPQVFSAPNPGYPFPCSSVGFWRTPCDLVHFTSEDKDRYSIPVFFKGNCVDGSIVYVGTDDPIPRIPSGSIVRISLSRSPGDFFTVQLSGFFL